MPSSRERRVEGRSRSKSPSRTRRGRSRSRSRGRSKSPGRKPRMSSESPSRSGGAGDGASPPKTPKTPKTPKISTTPVRRSARLEEKNRDSIDGNGDARPPVLLMKEEKPAEKPGHRYEFGGPLFTTLLTLALPAFLVLINDLCTKARCDLSELPALSTNVEDYFNIQAAGGYMGFLLFQAILAVLPIGSVVKGRPLNSGKTLKYRCNGLFALVVTAVVFSVCIYLEVPVVEEVLQNTRQIMCTAIAFAFLLSVFLYIRSRKLPAALRSPNGSTGNKLYGFFMGRELNPRIRSLDLKFFLGLRPSLIGLAVLNWCMLVTAYKADALSPALVVVTSAQMLYVADALLFEDSMLSGFDITTEGLGFMLAFTNVAWVPFMYVLQTRYIFEHTVDLPYWALALITLLNVIGYLIYRGSNSQKDLFSREPYSPAVAHLETIPTYSGKNLLVSGWWGLCQKPNYLGDLLVATAWALCAGFGSVVPYANALCMLVMLVHRQRRDSAHCQQKHGASWTRYCKRVRYRIIPYLY